MNAKNAISLPSAAIPLLAPLAWVYTAGTALHRRFGFRSSLKTRDHLLPLIVVGGIRSGGSGKTPVVLELARTLSRDGMRVGILAYWIRKPRGIPGGLRVLGPDVAEVFSDSDWQACSDEAVLLARDPGLRVFVTRNRERAWDVLSRAGGFDVLIADDGLMDPRLEGGALRLVLRSAGENPGPGGVLPAGPFHPVRMAPGDCPVEGPLSMPPKTHSDGLWFARELVLPAPPVSGPCLIVGGLGHPERFVQDLCAAGVMVSGMVMGPDHGLPDPGRVRKWRERHPDLQAVCSEKDWIKLVDRAEYGPMAVIKERITLGEGLLRRVRDYLQTRSTS